MILFGTAGVPAGLKSRRAEDGVREVKRLGLSAMELEFVRGVRMSEEGVRKVRAAAAETKVVLTAHGPYYINLASLEPETAAASRERILATARVAAACGGKSVTFHTASYQGRDPEVVFPTVARELRSLVGRLRKEDLRIKISPELTGKPTQFGSIMELIELARAVPGLGLCVDFSHHAARSAGEENGYHGFKNLLAALRRGLGSAALSNLHMHVSGIEWGEKGEKRHLMLQEAEFDWEGLLQALMEFRVSGILICESPVMEEDAMFLQKEYQKRAGIKK